MPLQTENLGMVGLGVVNDQPPHPIQPPLVDGIYLRWAFDPARGFPWHGYYLFRRLHRSSAKTCLAKELDPEWRVGRVPHSTIPLSIGDLTSDVPFVLTEEFADPKAREFDLRHRTYIRFDLSKGGSAREFHVTVGAYGKLGEDGENGEALSGCLTALLPFLKGAVSAPAPIEIRITAFDDDVPMDSTTVTLDPGQVTTASLSGDRLDRIEISGGGGALIDVCFVPVRQDASVGWQALPDFPYPLCLPTAAPGYPCAGRPANAAQAESMALARIRYGQASDWAPTVAELREVLDDLVVNGPPPGGLNMADRSESYLASPSDPDAPVMPDQRPLDLVLLGAVNPAVAQMVGLYWIDDPGDSNAYDYLLLADHVGAYGGDPQAALAAMSSNLPPEVDGWICFGLRKQAAAPLPPPAWVQAFALPGAATDPALIAQDLINAAGLRWHIEETDEGELLPGAAIGYHLWRADSGATEPTTPPASYAHITPGGMVMVAAPSPGADATLGPSDWPPKPMHKINGQLAEGWYSYRVSAMDIFGRLSAMSAPAEWRQWAPPPDPKPWYYLDPPLDAAVHPFAVRLLSKAPPPKPPGVEAWALDPLDPSLSGEAAYDAWHATGWWSGLPTADQPRRAGLRVRWRWEPAQMAQAPRTREFRIYLSPGHDPVPGYPEAAAWPERVYVVDADTHFTPLLDASGVPTGGREYEILLPEDAAGTDFAGVPLEPTDLDPVVYAHVGVSAADDRVHADDDSKWTSGDWGGRYGNEGPVGVAKIFRALRTPPPAPPLIGFDDKVWATRADYHGVSRYTVRWAKPIAGQKVHIFRAVDDSLFRADWERRAAAGAAAFTASDVVPFGWNPVDSAAVLAELVAPLDAVSALDWDSDPTVRAAYEALSERALRVLASLPDNSPAFMQMTFEPLDPADSVNADRAGPDATVTYTPNLAWGCWTAELDGRAANRYFFRAAYVNAAHTLGPLGPSTPAVYLPKVVPPLSPAITKVASGELAITLAWAHNREPDFAEYRIYRADDERQARDLRLMILVSTLDATGVDTSQPEVEWTDDQGLIWGRTYFYCVTAVDGRGNESTARVISAPVALDSTPPAPPQWIGAEWVLYDSVSGQELPWLPSGSLPPGYQPATRLELSTVGYRCDIYSRSEGSNEWQLVLAVPATTGQILSYYLDAAPGNVALYRAQAFSTADVSSKWSDKVSVQWP